MIDQPHGLGRVTDVDAVDLDTMVGDVRDLLLQEARDTRTALPWTSRSEREQREVIERTDAFSRRLVRQIATRLAVLSHPYVQVMRGAWTVKDGVKIVVTCAETPANIETIMAGTNTPLLVFVDTDAVQGERAPITPLADQPNLGDNDEDGPIFDRTAAGGR